MSLIIDASKRGNLNEVKKLVEVMGGNVLDVDEVRK